MSVFVAARSPQVAHDTSWDIPEAFDIASTSQLQCRQYDSSNLVLRDTDGLGPSRSTASSHSVGSSQYRSTLGQSQPRVLRDRTDASQRSDEARFGSGGTVPSFRKGKIRGTPFMHRTKNRFAVSFLRQQSCSTLPLPAKDSGASDDGFFGDCDKGADSLNSSQSTPNVTYDVSSSKHRETWTYNAPITSPFYRHVITPFCDHLIAHQWVPAWVTPNQLTLAGLFCGLAGLLAAWLRQFPFVILFWMGYGMFDNLDGKQARKTNKSSRAGDFLDHAVDSIMASLTPMVLLFILAPHVLNSHISLVYTVASQVPFYIGCCAHHILGRVLLGTQLSGRDIFTVDEVNLLVVPGLTLVRMYLPWILDSPLALPSFLPFADSTFTVIQKYTPAALLQRPEAVTSGLLMGLLSAVLCFVFSIIVVYRVYQPRLVSLLLPGMFFMALALFLSAPLFILVPCFSLMAFELIGLRVRIPHCSRQRLWSYVVVFALLSLGERHCRRWNAGAVRGVCSAARKVLFGVISALTAHRLLYYKNVLEALDAL